MSDIFSMSFIEFIIVFCWIFIFKFDIVLKSFQHMNSLALLIDFNGLSFTKLYSAFYKFLYFCDTFGSKIARIQAVATDLRSDATLGERL